MGQGQPGNGRVDDRRPAGGKGSLEGVLKLAQCFHPVAIGPHLFHQAYVVCLCLLELLAVSETLEDGRDQSQSPLIFQQASRFADIGLNIKADASPL